MDKQLKEITRKEITEKIRTLKKPVGNTTLSFQGFVLYSKSQRTIACRQGRILKDSDLIPFEITTCERGDGTFVVIAV